MSLLNTSEALSICCQWLTCLFKGIDLTKNTLTALAEQGQEERVQGDTNELISLVTAIPNQGILQPYEKIPVFFRFSPR